LRKEDTVLISTTAEEVEEEKGRRKSMAE